MTVDTVWNTLESVSCGWWSRPAAENARGYAIGTDSMVIVISDKTTAGVRSMVSLVLPRCKVIRIEAPIEVSMFCPGPVSNTGPFLCGHA